MKIKYDDLWFCVDCTMFASTGELDEGLSKGRMRAVTKGVAAWGRNLVEDFDSDSGEGVIEYSARMCDSCGTHLAGSRHRYAVLG